MILTIEEWHKEFFPLVYRRCKYMLRNNKYDPEDAAQDVFLNLLKNKENGEGITNPEGLLWTIATRECLNKLKAKKWKMGENLFLIEEIHPASGNDYNRIEAKLFIQNLLETESEEVQSFYYMHYYDGMGYVEIAKAAGKSKSWVGKKLSDFKDKVQKYLKEI